MKSNGNNRYIFLAVHYNKAGELLGFRIYSTAVRKYVDMKYDKIKKILTDTPGIIEGLELDIDGNVKGSNGALSRYDTYIDNKIGAKAKKLIILNTIDDLGYTVSDSKGNLFNLKTDDILNALSKYGDDLLANGKVVRPADKKAFISSIRGNYINIPMSDLDGSKFRTVKQEVVNENVAKEIDDIKKDKFIRYSLFDGGSNRINYVTCDRKLLQLVNEKHGNNVTVEEKIIYAEHVLKRVRPLYYYILTGLKQKVWTLSIDTSAVTPTELLLNPYYINMLSPSEVIWTLTHEICHLMMQHHYRLMGRNHQLWNIATDLYINAFIENDFKVGKFNYRPVSIDGDSRYTIQFTEGKLFSADIDLAMDTAESIYREILEEAENNIEFDDDDGEEDNNDDNDVTYNDDDTSQENPFEWEEEQKGNQGTKNIGSKSRDNKSMSQLPKNKSGNNNNQNGQDGQSSGSQTSNTQNGQNGQSSGSQTGNTQNGQNEEDCDASAEGGNTEEGTQSDNEKSGASNSTGQSIDSEEGNSNEDRSYASVGLNNKTGKTDNIGIGADSLSNKGDSTGEYKNATVGSTVAGADKKKGKRKSYINFRGQKIEKKDIDTDLVLTQNSPVTASDIRQKTTSLLSSAVTRCKKEGSWGKNPGLLERLVEDALAPKVNWKRLLKNKLTKASQSIYTFSAPNRKYRSRGLIVPGPKMLGNDTLESVKICVDTSGSISNKDLGIALAQIKQLLDIYKAKAELLYWDTEVAAVYEFSDPKEMLRFKPAGGGGTDANCIFDYFETNKDYRLGRKPKPEIIVVITDGYFDKLDSKYKKYKDTIWIVNNGKRGFNPGFGTVASFFIED